MKLNFAAFALIAGLAFSATASAEDRVQAGYFAGNGVSDSWGVSGEKNVLEIGSATVFVEGSADRFEGVDNTTTALGAGVQFNVTKNLLAKVSVVNNFAEYSNDYLTYKAGLVYSVNDWRLSGSVLKTEGYSNLVGEVTAERKLVGNFGVGAGALFDKSDYLGTQLFVSYSF